MRARRLFVPILVASFLGAGAAAHSAPFTVGTASAEPGTRATGYIEVPEGVDAATRIPVVLVNGSRPGPVLALVSGLHGTEYASIVALEELSGRLDPADVSGTVILLPLVNVPSFLGKVPHVNPVDGKSMNRFYPGRADGTQTERASYWITKEVVDRCDYLIDYHGGDLDESLRPYSYWSPVGDAAEDRASKEMVLAFGLDHIIIWRDMPRDPLESRYLHNTAALRGKPSIAVEAGHAGTVEADDVRALVEGTSSVMRQLRMLPGEPTPVAHPVWIERLSAVASDDTGIFYPLVRRGTYVAAGMKLGYVTDYFGATLSDVTATADGIVLYINALPSVKKGDTVASLGVVASRAP